VVKVPDGTAVLDKAAVIAKRHGAGMAEVSRHFQGITGFVPFNGKSVGLLRHELRLNLCGGNNYMLGIRRIEGAASGFKHELVVADALLPPPISREKDRIDGVVGT